MVDLLFKDEKSKNYFRESININNKKDF